MNRIEILNKFPESLTPSYKKKAERQLNQLIGECYIYIEKSLLNTKKNEIENFVENLLNLQGKIDFNKLPIKLRNFETNIFNEYEFKNYIATNKTVIINEINDNLIETNYINKNDIRLFLFKNETNKNKLKNKHEKYFKNNLASDIFIVFDTFTPNLNILYKDNIFAIPLTYKGNKGINEFIQTEYLSTEKYENHIIRNFEINVNKMLKSDTRISNGVKEISNQVSIIEKYNNIIINTLEYYYTFLRNLYNINFKSENQDLVSHFAQSSSGYIGSLRIKNILEEEKESFIRQHNKAIANYTVELAINLINMTEDLYKEDIELNVIKNSLTNAILNINQNKNFIKIIEPYLKWNFLEPKLNENQKTEIFRKVIAKLKRKVILNDVDQKISKYLKNRNKSIYRKIEANDTIFEIEKNIFYPSINTFEYNYWIKDMKNEMTILFNSIYRYIWNDFKVNNPIYSEDEYKEIEERIISNFKNECI